VQHLARLLLVGQLVPLPQAVEVDPDLFGARPEVFGREELAAPGSIKQPIPPP